MFKVAVIAIAVVVAVAFMSGVITVQFHSNKVSDLTKSITALVMNKGRLAAGQKMIDGLKKQGVQIFAKTSPSPEVAGAKDAKEDKIPSVDLKANISLPLK